MGNKLTSIKVIYAENYWVKITNSHDADLLCNLFHSLGWKWSSGDSYRMKTLFGGNEKYYSPHLGVCAAKQLKEKNDPEALVFTINEISELSNDPVIKEIEEIKKEIGLK